MAELERYSYLTNELNRMIADLVIDFIDSNVLGKLSISTGPLGGSPSVTIERYRFTDQDVDSYDEDELVQDFSPGFVAEQMDLSKVRAINVNRPRPSIVDIETERNEPDDE